MRRIIIVGTALAVLVTAGAAYAAFNSYVGTTQTFLKGAGTPSKPVGIGFTQSLAARNLDPTKASAVLTDIQTTIYGLKSQSKYFRSCSAARMSLLKSDSFCPPKSKFATGVVHSLLGDPTLALSSRIHCDPNLDVFNAGGGKLWFFFTTHSNSQCAGLKTGATPAYQGTVTQKGPNQVTDVPLPKFVGTMVAFQPNFYGSLVQETLNWAKVATQHNGKTVYNDVSVGCQHGKRKWSIKFTSTTGSGPTSSSTVSGSSSC